MIFLSYFALLSPTEYETLSNKILINLSDWKRSQALTTPSYLGRLLRRRVCCLWRTEDRNVQPDRHLVNRLRQRQQRLLLLSKNLSRFSVKFESENSEFPLAGSALVQTPVGYRSVSRGRVHLHENLKILCGHRWMYLNSVYIWNLTQNMIFKDSY